MAQLDFKTAIFHGGKVPVGESASALFALSDLINWGPFLLMAASQTTPLSLPLRRGIQLGALATMGAAALRLRLRS